MKTIKTYENFMDFDPDFAIAKIKHFYSDYDVKNMVDNEIENWVEDDQISNNYEGKVDWYYDNASGEAEEVVIGQLINWYEDEFKKELNEEQKDQLSKVIIKEYPGIDPNNY
jgi:BioD-like phosphotransacetylase family protein